MATVRSAHTVWQGNLNDGKGEVTLDTSGLGTYDVTWKARAEQAEGKTSPEELIGAAHSACYSMQFSAFLAEDGYNPERVETKSDVTFDPAAGGITTIKLTVSATIAGISDEDFQKIAEKAKTSCPVSKALAGVEISMDASLSAA